MKKKSVFISFLFLKRRRCISSSNPSCSVTLSFLQYLGNPNPAPPLFSIPTPTPFLKTYQISVLPIPSDSDHVNQKNKNNNAYKNDKPLSRFSTLSLSRARASNELSLLFAVLLHNR